MKLTLKTPVKSKSGMTLLELTVVILVLLSLISILFIGARAWKRGSDRAAAILTIRNTQQAIRSHANMSALNPGDAFVSTDVFGPGKFIEENPIGSNHPAGTDYDFAINPGTTTTSTVGGVTTTTTSGAATVDTVPDVGVAYIATTGGSDASYFNPASTEGW